ncbi:MAG: methyltransferase family protein [Promethearchaeota archaeon]
MDFRKSKIRKKIEAISTRISSIVIPIFQYVPCLSVWRGIMSVPLITYLILFFQNPKILSTDFVYLFQTPGIYFIIFGFLFFVYSLIFQLTHRKQLIRTGPYKYMRHPQYLAFILMTLGMTIVAFQTTPIFEFPVSYENGFSILFFIWICEVFAYILLGKIEEIALKAKYGTEFLEYRGRVAFIIPFLKVRGNKIIKA